MRSWEARLVAALAGCAIALACWRWSGGPDLTRTYRIGYEHSPPRQVVLPDGSPSGSAIEIIKEAARRSGIRLEWVRAYRGPDQALTDGMVDLWPALNKLPGRRHLHFSEPFSQIN